MDSSAFVALSLPAKKSFLIWVCMLICLLPFVILSFFNFVAYDDYAAVGNFSAYGFWGTQKMIYLQWEGRFTATFLCGICERAGILTRHYYLVFFLFAVGTWASVVFLLDSVNTYFLHRAFSRRSLILAGLILFVLDIYVMVEMSSGIYWFSPTAVYQTSFILFLLLTGFLIRRLAGARGSRRATGLDAVIVLLSILLCGSNEPMTIALVCFLLLIMGAYRYFSRPMPKSLFLYLGVILITGVIIVSTSGILSYRQVLMKGHLGYVSVIAILFFRVVSVFYYILKEPLFWACAGACFILGMRVSTISSLSPVVGVLKSKRFFIFGLAAVVLLIFFALAPVLFVTHGSIPERALNDMTSLAAFGLLAMVFLLGFSNPSLAQTVLPIKYLTGGLLFFIGCGLLASFNYKEVWKNVFTGYFYHGIQADRQEIFMDAREHGRHVATIKSYEAALDEKVRQVFPNGAPVTLQHWLEDRPTLLYFDNEAEDLTGKYLHEYYGLDSIFVQPRP